RRRLVDLLRDRPARQSRRTRDDHSGLTVMTSPHPNEVLPILPVNSVTYLPGCSEVNVSAAPETLGPRYFLRRGCSRKNSHIWRVASTPLLVGPTNHSGSGWPPGQVWPPPLMV